MVSITRRVARMNRKHLIFLFALCIPILFGAIGCAQKPDHPDEDPPSKDYPVLELMTFPGRTLNPIVADIENLQERALSSTQFRKFIAQLNNVKHNVIQTKGFLSDGKPLRAMRGIDLAQRTARRMIDSAHKSQSKLLRSRVTQNEAAAGDTSEAGFELAGLDYLLARFETLERSLQETHRLYQRLPSARDLQRIKGTVLKADDANNRLILTDGKVIALPKRGLDFSISVGSNFLGTAYALDDGSDFVVTIAAATDLELSIVPGACIDFGIAPVQPFPPEFPEGRFQGGFALGDYGRQGLEGPQLGTEPYTVHDMDAYLRPFGSYVIEEGMRVVAVKRPCPTDISDTDEDFQRYSLSAVLRIPGPNATIAAQLEPGDEPVPLPEDLGGVVGTIDVSYRQQHCVLKDGETKWVAAVDRDELVDCSDTSAPCPCSPDTLFCPVFDQWDALTDLNEPYACDPPKEIHKESFPVIFLAQGGGCTAAYNQTVFDISDVAIPDRRSARVTSVRVQPIFDAAQFWADGNDPNTPLGILPDRVVADRIPVTFNTDFAVYHWEPCFEQSSDACPDLLFTLRDNPAESFIKGGTDEPSALRWPRIVGLNNGRQYALSCRLPRITRDAVDFCSNSPNSFYKFPLPGGVWEMGQANSACNCPTCNNCSCSHATGCAQQFAFDIPAPAGTHIRAMRGGRVAVRIAGRSGNCWQQSTCTMGAWGNYVTLEHQDGTATSYMHMPTGGPTVIIRQVIKRGTQIGAVGNTGNSSGAHLHTQEQVSPTNGNTNRMRFELLRFDGLQIINNFCYTPKKGDSIQSTNTPPP